MTDYERLRLKDFYAANPELHEEQLRAEVNQMLWAIVESCFLLANNNPTEVKRMLRHHLDFTGVDEGLAARAKDEANRLYARRLELTKKYPNLYAKK